MSERDGEATKQKENQEPLKEQSAWQKEASAVLQSGSSYLGMNTCYKLFLAFSFLESSFLVLKDIEPQESSFAHFDFILYFPSSETFRNFKIQTENSYFKILSFLLIFITLASLERV